MKILATALKELRAGLNKALIFTVMLDALIVFLAAYLVLSIFNIPAILAFSITMAYLIVETAKRASISKIRKVEEYYPRLNERLRTSAEYINAENPVVNELHQEVLTELRNVEEAEFLDDRKSFAKAGIITLLCFLVLLLAPVSIKLDPIDAAVEKVKAATEINVSFELGKGEPTPGGAGGGKKGGAKLASEDDIFGAPSIAKLGEEELKLVIKPAGDSINIRQIKDAEESEFADSEPKEAFAVSAAAYEEKIPREQQEIVKNYFTAIAKGT
ncbi:hypothetical protein HYV82_01060 [Candidatus Woesearchaeota archaeon]|nr:hypothetical protein [Candidatus Woesearchaeota archaeon]